MKHFKFILGTLLLGIGVLVISGTTVLIISGTSEFPLSTNLLGLFFLGLVPCVLGLFLWLHSGAMRNSKAMWFFIGVFVSWSLWVTVVYVRSGPRDYTQSLTGLERKDYPQHWLKNSYGRRLGSFLIFTPVDSSIASAFIHPIKPNNFPQIIIQDENKDGRVDNILICDSVSQHVSLTDTNADGVFDYHGFSTGICSNSIYCRDNNMDGEYDIRLGPGLSIAVAIDSEWYDLIRTNNKAYVEINGALAPVRSTNGVWKVMKEE